MQNDKRRQVLDMLLEGNITVDDALELLDALDEETIHNEKNKKRFTFFNQDDMLFEFDDPLEDIDHDIKDTIQHLKDSLHHVKDHIDEVKHHSKIIIEKKRKKA